MKKIISMLLVLVMILALAVPAMAAETVTLTINHIADNHTYEAYQIFDGTLTDGGILTDIKWGPGVDGDALLAALKADETPIYDSTGVNYVQFSTLFANAADADDVVEILENFTTNGDRLERFAEIVAQYVVEDKAIESGPATKDGDVYKYTIEGLDPGYYIVLDATASDKVGAEDYKTRYILSLTTHTSLVTKGDYSTVTKNVNDTLDGTYSEYIASQLNKEVYFKWEVALDDDLEEFDSYFLAFDDVMNKGLTFNGYEEVYVEEVDGTKIYLYKDGKWQVDADAGINGTPDVNTVTTKTAGTRRNGNTYSADQTYICLAWKDLKSAYTAIAGDDKLVVKYSAFVNEDAVYGDAITNDVFIEFSNGPDGDDHGFSVPDYAFVFSFGLKVIKVDADSTTTVLPGAEFLLYHLHGTEKHYAYVVDGKAVAWTPYTTDEQVEAAKAAIDADTTLSNEEKEAAKAEVYKATTLVSDTNGNIHVDGLDEDVTYYLHETNPPAGYNTMFTDVKFSIHPAYTIDSGVPKVASITYIVDGATYTVSSGEDFEAGRVVVTVVNDKGNTLPSTGGIGTTLFYIFGGMMVVGAAVLLVTKKRMTAQN